MMDKPTEKDIGVFTCGACECMTFNLLSDGSIRCGYCHKPLRQHEGEHDQWRRKADIEPDAMLGFTGVIDNHFGDVNFARDTALGKINRWRGSDELKVVFATNDDGRTSNWVGFTSNEEAKEAVKSLRELIDWIEKREWSDDGK